MSRFTIWIMNQPGTSHGRVFVEHAHSIACALRRLGHVVDFAPGDAGEVRNPIARRGETGRLIVFGAHVLPEVPLPDDAIIYNAEQIDGFRDVYAATHWDNYKRILDRQIVWDYNKHNIKLLGGRARLCRVGYVSEALRTPSGLDEDIDVLFIGSMNNRRQGIIEALQYCDVQGRPIVVKTLFGVYGAERDWHIARAKIVLNIHFFAPGIFEIFRCAHLLANSKCVVSESGSADGELDALGERATAYVPIDRLVDTCRSLLDGADAAERRRAIAEKGRSEFAKIDQVAEVKSALEGS